MPSTDSTANQPPHPTCAETTTTTQMAMGFRSYVCGRDCPRPLRPFDGAPGLIVGDTANEQRDNAYAAYDRDEAAVPARDARRRVRAERERRRAARALDRYMEIMLGPDHPITDTHEVWRVAGERFVEAVGDYVLSELHHNGDYGVSPEVFRTDDRDHELHVQDHDRKSWCLQCQAKDGEDLRERDHPCAGGRCSDPAAHAEGAHDV